MKVLHFLLVLVIPLLTSGCHYIHDQIIPENEQTNENDNPELKGKWALHYYKDDKGNKKNVSEDLINKVWIDFNTDSTLSLNSSCNSGGADYSLMNKNKIRIGPVFSTRKYCADIRGEWENILFNGLNKARKYNQKTNQLILITTKGEKLFFEPFKKLPEEKNFYGKWNLYEIKHGKDSVESVPNDLYGNLSINLDSNKHVSIQTTCNNGKGKYHFTIVQDNIKGLKGKMEFRNFMFTEMACIGKKGKWEQKMVGPLQKTKSFKLSDNKLKLVCETKELFYKRP